jgi:hypothetical protein
MKTHPYYPRDFLEWWRRIQLNRTFYSQPHSVRLQICQQEGIRYYVIPTDLPTPPEAVIATAEPFELVDCR